MNALNEFKESLNREDIVNWIRSGLIGDDVEIQGPFGPKEIIYADYVASGRALSQVEDFIRDKVLPFYSNSHTQASFCGSYITNIRETSRSEIARMTCATSESSVIFTGSGTTAGINKLVGLLNIGKMIYEGKKVVVLVGPYEHHSNLLPWRDSGAEIIEIEEDDNGGLCLNSILTNLKNVSNAELVIGTFSAASNVTGIVTDVKSVSKLLKSFGALSIWDYGCGAPYLPMSMKLGSFDSIDAIVFSPHKFLGGPAASGILIVRNEIVKSKTPTLPGGGTVDFVSPWGHSYSENISKREEGGTPNVIGDIRVALVMLIKEALNQDWLLTRQTALRKKVLKKWKKNNNLEIFKSDISNALPIISFRVKHESGGYIHHQLFTRLLSDIEGVQARGGCACAGPYAHRLLGLRQKQSFEIENLIKNGQEIEKPGWIRLNFSALMTDSKVDRLINSVDRLASTASKYVSFYEVNEANAQFIPKKENIKLMRRVKKNYS